MLTSKNYFNRKINGRLADVTIDWDHETQFCWIKNIGHLRSPLSGSREDSHGDMESGKGLNLNFHRIVNPAGRSAKYERTDRDHGRMGKSKT